MKRFRQSLTVAAGVLALAGVVAVTTPQRASAQLTGQTTIVPVKVTNTPLPVAAQGTTTVAGSVQAQQSGTWTVGVVPGTTVGLAAGTTIGVNLAGTSVTVANPAASPVLVRDVDARQPFQTDFPVQFLPGAGQGGVFGLGVPIGKRFVVEHVSALFTLPPGQTIVSATLVGSDATCQCIDFLAPVLVGRASDGSSVFVANHQTRVYAGDGNNSGFMATRYPADATATIQVFLSGYLMSAQ